MTIEVDHFESRGKACQVDHFESRGTDGGVMETEILFIICS